MTTYARLSSDLLTVERLVDLTPAEFAGMQTNGKAARLRPWVAVSAPAPSAGQVVEPAAPVIAPTTVTQAWNVRAQTAAEQSADAQAALLVVLKQAAAAFQADIDANDLAAPTTAAQAFVDIANLKRRALRTDKALLWLVKQQS